ncbi:MAG: hypothetical protein A2Z25_07485 [Planctomycetes bacterium RBG_16_55_9]|nr:MAG: hypothetical protein A2Z25_07485 [Planctomycetes bacterium RBG_16_55_9]
MAHENLWGQLIKLDGQQTAQRAKCQYLSNPACYIIAMLSTEYVVDFSDRKIYPIGSRPNDESAGFLEQLCLLAYLINARDLPLANKLVNAHALPAGQFFFRGIHSLPTGKLEKAFGDCPSRLHDVSRQLGAERCEFGDGSIRLYVLPRVPLTVVVWGRCEEFEARASILFDESAADQLPLDALLAAVNLTLDALVEAANADK